MWILRQCSLHMLQDSPARQPAGAPPRTTPPRTQATTNTVTPVSSSPKKVTTYVPLNMSTVCSCPKMHSSWVSIYVLFHNLSLCFKWQNEIRVFCVLIRNACSLMQTHTLKCIKVRFFFTEKTAVSHWWYEFLVQLKFEILKIKVIGSKTLWEILVLT